MRVTHGKRSLSICGMRHSSREDIGKVLTAAFALIIALGTLARGAHAQPSLLNRSPFIPPNFDTSADSRTATPTPSSAAGQIEFRGVYSIGGNYHFNIFNKRENKGLWVEMDDRFSPYRVLSYDEKTDTIRIVVDGREESISMHRPTWQPTPIAGVTDATPGNVAPGTPGSPGRPSETGPRPPPRRRVVTPPSREAIEAARRRWQNMPPNQRPPTPPPEMVPEPHPSMLDEDGNIRSGPPVPFPSDMMGPDGTVSPPDLPDQDDPRSEDQTHSDLSESEEDIEQ